MRLSSTAIRRPVTTVLLTCALVIFGWYGLQNNSVDLFPEIDFPTVTVIAILPGADAEIMDTDVTDVLEEQIKSIEGVKTIRSVSTAGRSRIVVEFVLAKNSDVAAQEVRAKINVAQADLPQDLEPPIVDKIDVSSQPIVWIAVTSAGAYRERATYVDDVVKPRLQTVAGVGAIELRGFQDREIRVWLDPFAMEARGVSPVEVAQAIRAKHIELPGGRIEQPDKEFVVKVQGEYESVDSLQRLVIRNQGEAVIRLEDIASVEDGAEDLRSMARFNGMTAVGLGIRKQSGTNTVAVANEVIDALDSLSEAPGPEGFHPVPSP